MNHPTIPTDHTRRLMLRIVAYIVRRQRWAQKELADHEAAGTLCPINEAQLHILDLELDMMAKAIAVGQGDWPSDEEAIRDAADHSAMRTLLAYYALPVHNPTNE